MKRISLTAIALVLTTALMAQGWVDITSSTITNPSYDNDSKAGWTIEKTRNGYSTTYSLDTRCGAQESWWGAADIYQIITLPQTGRYRLSVNGFFRVDTGTTDAYYAYQEDSEEMTAFLYADDMEIPMASYYSATLDKSKQSEWMYNGSNPYWTSPDGTYFCNDMENAVYQFENGKYTNVLEFEGNAGDEIQIGVRNYEDVSGNWLIIDNWKLEMWGTEVMPTSISLNKTTLTLKQGQLAQLTATVVPSNATNKAVSWSSSNTAVATVSNDGRIYAKGVGSATITVRSNAKSTVTKTCRVTVTANNIADGLDESQWANVTATTIMNSKFDSNPQWSGDWTIETTCQNNTYNYGAQEFFNGTSDIYQTFTVPAPGLYRVGVKAFYRTGDYSNAGWNAYNNGTEDITAFLYANDYQTPLKSAYSESLDGETWSGLKALYLSDGTRYFPNSMYSAVNGFFAEGKYQNYLIVEVGDDCELTVGIRNANALSGNWIIMDDWTLEQYGGEEVIIDADYIYVYPEELTLEVGKYSWIDYSVQPENATDKELTITASNPDIVYFSVYSDYIYIQGLAEGTTNITFALKSNPSIKTVVPVIVTPAVIPATAITLNRTTASVKVGETLTLTASLQPEDSTDDPAVSWKSSNTSVASVSTAGVVTAKAAGTAVITATLKANTELTATCEISVFKQDDIVQEWLDMTSEYVVNPNFNGSADGWVVDYDGSTATNYGYQNANYSNGSVRISQFVETWRNQNRYYDADLGGFVWSHLGDGSIYQVIEGLPAGKYRLEADVIAVDQNGGNNPVTGVELFMSDASGENVTALATDNGAPEHFTVTYDTDGSAVTIGARTVETFANWLAFDNVKLYWYGTEVKGIAITLNTTRQTLVQGETLQLTPTVSPANTTFPSCTFESSNTACATVDASGLVTAVKPGMSTITVRLQANAAVTATCIVTVTANEVMAGAILINEVQQSNVDMFVDPSFNYGGWVELYNTTNTSVSLDGLYISDDPANLKKFALNAVRHGAVPAKGFATLWFDHYSWWAPKMIDFKLDCDGGSLYISNEAGTIITECDYAPAITRTSFARTTNGGSEWSYTDQPTPGASNATSSFALTRLEAPEIDTEGQLFTGTLLAQVTNIPAGATLRYTLDGSTPTLENGQTSTDGLFSFDQTTILRLRYFQDGYLSSAVVTRSYIYKDRDYSLPVLSLVSDNANLYGDDLGIFVRGNGNGRPGNGQSSACNWNMEWDRPANIEFFTEEGQAVISQEVGIEASGGWSRAWAPHSFNIKANKIYEGQNRMDYQFFSNKPYLRHKALKVRNGGNDYNGGRIKDAAIQQVVTTSGLYAETQSYQPVHVFHNGQYIGVENLREPNNKNYGYANYGIDTDDQDQWKMSPDSGYVQQAGTREAWDEWYSLAQNASDALSYERIKELVDIEEYINYMAIELYIAGTDWPKNNIKAFRDRVNAETSNGRFRFVLFDTDGAFATNNSFSWFDSTNWWNFDQLYGQQVLEKYGNRISAEIEFVTIFRNMLNNAEFRKQFIDQFCLVAGSVFEPSRSAAVINGMISYVTPAMRLEGISPSSANSVISNFGSSRQSNSVSNMRSYLGLDTPMQVTLSANIDEARLLVNDLQVPTNKFAGRLFAPITLKASAPAGYQFVGWQTNQSTSATTLFAKGSAWNYYDHGSLDGENWKDAAYNASWSNGNAPLGYDTGNASKAAAYNTTLSYGGSSSNKYPSYYFRKQVNLSTAPKSSETFTLDWIADDGFVVYVNGTEAGRFLMNNTPNPTFSSFADTYANANPESGQMILDASLFKRGNNIIAVELHNNSANSTDIYWDAALLYTRDSDGNYASTEETFQLPVTTSAVTYRAVYERLNDNADDAWDAHPVKINEVSAGNEIYVNDLFKKNDWIELYNTTDQPYNVNGMYLSDNLAKPDKFQIIDDGTASTVIPAHGHLVIWCDKLEGVSQLHASFKLSNTDSCSVLLTAEDKSWADTLTYCAHNGYQSVGLFPDGGSDLYVMERPTIGQTNVLTTTALAYEEPKITPTPVVAIDDISDDSDLALLYKNRTLTLTGAPYARVDIYNAAGQLVMTARANAGAALSLAALPHGIYVATAKTDDDQTTLKFHLQ